MIQIVQVVARIVHEEHLMVQLLLGLLGGLDELIREVNLLSSCLHFLMRFSGTHHV